MTWQFSLAGLFVGVLVGMTGMGGGSLMTPLLVLIFGIQPTTAIGTDIFYAAITKTAGTWRHLKLKTVYTPLVFWMAVGSVPSALAGVWFLDYLERRLGDNLDQTVFAILAGCLLVVGAATLLRGFFLADKIQERDDFEMHTRHKVAAVGIGATTGFIIGLSSAGSGTLIGIMLIAVYRLTPNKVVGTDVVHAALLLWAASISMPCGVALKNGGRGVGNSSGCDCRPRLSPAAARAANNTGGALQMKGGCSGSSAGVSPFRMRST